MSDCTEYYELISAFADGELDESECRDIEQHIESCADCARLLEVLRGISAAASGSFVTVPETLCVNVMSAIFNEDAPLATVKKQSGLRKILTRYVPMAACLAIILLALPRLPGLGCSSSAPSATMTMTGGGGFGAVSNDAAAPAAAPELSAADSAEDIDAPLAEPRVFEDGGDQYNEGEYKVGEEIRVSEAIPPSASSAAGGSAVLAPGGYIYETPEEAQFGEYYAVIILTGDLPELPENSAAEDISDGIRYIYIPREAAVTLIGDGYEHTIFDENSETALVIYYY